MKLFMGVCNSQHEVPAEFFWSVIGIKQICEIVPFRSRHPWDVIRNNVIIDRFLKSDCDILVKMDIDQSYPSNYFERFVPLVEQFKVIGPLIYDRWKTNQYMPLAFKERYNGFMLEKFDLSDCTGIVDIKYAHTNLFYAREVLEKIPPPWYEAVQSKNGLERANHVDYDFIDKIHNAGYPTYIDLSTVVGHQKVEYETGNS
jgi:hypothetical protein